MCGIFAYLNFLTPRKRSEVIDILIKGLQRMEYRGYDSAGMHFFQDTTSSGLVVRFERNGQRVVNELTF